MNLSAKLATARTTVQRQKIVDAVTEVGRHPICQNLALVIDKKTGRRHYTISAIIAGTKGQEGRRDGIPAVVSLPTHLWSLEQAEAKMRTWVGQCKGGNDPRLSDEELARKAQTFLMFWAKHAPAIMCTQKGVPFSEKERAAWHRAVGTIVDEDGAIKANPDADKSNSLVALHGKMLHQIDINIVEDALKPIYAAGGSTPRRTRHKLERIFTHAMLREGKLVKVNPVTNVTKLNTLVDKHEVEQHPCIKYTALPDFMRDLHHDGEFTGRILELMILTTTRSQEIRGMRWEEIQWDADGGPIWIVPAERMKRKLPHIIPLSTQAVFLLKALGVKKEGLVFPSRWGVRETKEGHVEGNALIGALRDRFELKNEKGEIVVPHGFRATFGGWFDELTDFSEDLRELQLAHRRRVKDEKGNDLVSPAVVAAYARLTKVEKRRVVLQAYADFAMAKVSANNVVQLKAVA